MSTKTVEIADVGTAFISKRKGQKSIRITISGNKIKVTQPSWLPFSAGETFARSKREWLREHTTQSKIYSHGTKIGKDHTLVYLHGERLTTRIGNEYIRISIPSHLTKEHPDVQDSTLKAVEKALRMQSEKYLPLRTKELAIKHGFTHSTITIKKLQRRWGSCNSQKEITYNLNLMSLPYAHIDYVILHELTHTLHMNHGEPFWNHLESVLPGARKLARIVRRVRPD